MSMVFSWRPAAQPSSESLGMSCPRCEGWLTLHQPDADLPDRLLATCSECKSWFLASSDATALARLPELPNETARLGSAS